MRFRTPCFTRSALTVFHMLKHTGTQPLTHTHTHAHAYTSPKDIYMNIYITNSTANSKINPHTFINTD